jgi:hypothetical protein
MSTIHAAVMAGPKRAGFFNSLTPSGFSALWQRVNSNAPSRT